MTSRDFKHDFSHKMWALLYLHDWDEPTAANPRPIYPEIHGVYDSEAEALENQKAMVKPQSYHVRIVYPIRKIVSLST